MKQQQAERRESPDYEKHANERGWRAYKPMVLEDDDPKELNEVSGTTAGLKCERCGRPGSDVLGEACLCEECLAVVVREWKIRFEEFGQLEGARA